MAKGIKVKFWRPPFFVSSEEKLFENIGRFVAHVVEAVDSLDKGVVALVKRDAKSLKENVENVSKAEETADEIRRVIEKELYEGRFFDKAEKIDLIEKIDDVADNAEMAAQAMILRELVLPKNISESLIELTDSTKKTTVALRHAVVQLYTNFSGVPQYVRTIETERDKVRSIYAKLIQELYTSNLSAASMMILRDLAFRIMRTADMAEEAADRVSFLAVKYA